MGELTVNGQKQKGVAVEEIETQSGVRIVALASVRPKGAKWEFKPQGRPPIEAVFIFDQMGKLKYVFGDDKRIGNERRDTKLVQLGGTGDFFVRVRQFESEPPYKYTHRLYKLDEPENPALTFHYRRKMGASIPSNKTSIPLSEFASLGSSYEPGKNDAGLPVPHAIVWDRATGKFYGEQIHTYDGKPGYKIVVEESARFQSVSTKPGEVTALGGRRTGNWHSWRVVVPVGKDLSAKLELRDAAGKTLQLIREDKLSPGQHNFQLCFNLSLIHI